MNDLIERVRKALQTSCNNPDSNGESDARAAVKAVAEWMKAQDNEVLGWASNDLFEQLGGIELS